MLNESVTECAGWLAGMDIGPILFLFFNLFGYSLYNGNYNIQYISNILIIIPTEAQMLQLSEFSDQSTGSSDSYKYSNSVRGVTGATTLVIMVTMVTAFLQC